MIRVSVLELTASQRSAIDEVIAAAFAQNAVDASDVKTDVRILVDYNETEANEFQALFDNIKYSFNTIFNAADSFVCIGATLLVLALILEMKEEIEKEKLAKEAAERAAHEESEE